MQQKNQNFNVHILIEQILQENIISKFPWRNNPRSFSFFHVFEHSGRIRLRIYSTYFPINQKFVSNKISILRDIRKIWKKINHITDVENIHSAYQ